MPHPPNARRLWLRRIIFALVALAAIVLTGVLILALTVPFRGASAPPIAEKTAIIVSPHPDDETYSMGQTIATQDIEGVRTVAVLVTDGDSSVYVEWWAEEHGRDLDDDGDVDRWDFGLARREEYKKALEILGVDEVIFLGAADSQGKEGFQDTKVDADELSDALASIAEDNPGADWYTTAPYEAERWYRGDYKNHPDHGQVATAVADVARKSAGTAHWFKVYVYYLQPFARFAPVRVEGTPEARERKRAAVEAFSVIGGTSTPELYDSSPDDEAEYLVPVPDE